MGWLLFESPARVAGGAVGLALLLGALACGQPPMNDAPPMPPGPVYQWHPVDGHASGDGHMFDGHRRENWRMNREGRRDSRRESGFEMSPRISAGWFERPYPDHLDFFRMRFGSRVGALGPPYGPTLPAYYGPYYTGYPVGYASPNGQMENDRSLIEVPDGPGTPAAAGTVLESTDGVSLPAPTRDDRNKSQN